MRLFKRSLRTPRRWDKVGVRHTEKIQPLGSLRSLASTYPLAARFGLQEYSIVAANMQFYESDFVALRPSVREGIVG